VALRSSAAHSLLARPYRSAPRYRIIGIPIGRHCGPELRTVVSEFHDVGPSKAVARGGAHARMLSAKALV
jgi:hypothetical protein